MFEEEVVLDNVYMSDEDLYNFFNRYSLDELELFKLKFDFVKDSKENKEVFEQVYLEKKENYVNNQEDDRTIAEKIMDKNKSLTDIELNYLYGFTTSIPTCFVEGLVFLNVDIYKELERRHLEKIDDPVTSMSSEDLENFFNKYELHELEEFQLLFTYAKDYNLTEAFDIIRKTYDKKSSEMSKEDTYFYQSISRHIKKKVTLLKNKNNELSKKELLFLKALVEDSTNYISTSEYDSFLEQSNDLEELLESINEEISNRKTIKLTPKK